jgi:hypothetical protein
MSNRHPIRRDRFGPASSIEAVAEIGVRALYRRDLDCLFGDVPTDPQLQIEDSDAEITAESRPGDGTTVSSTCPRVPDDDE